MRFARPPWWVLVFSLRNHGGCLQAYEFLKFGIRVSCRLLEHSGSGSWDTAGPGRMMIFARSRALPSAIYQAPSCARAFSTLGLQLPSAEARADALCKTCSSHAHALSSAAGFWAPGLSRSCPRLVQALSGGRTPRYVQVLSKACPSFVKCGIWGPQVCPGLVQALSSAGFGAL